MTQSPPVAITGIGCRFPGGVDTPAKFWELLRSGVDAITDVPADRWNTASYYDARPGQLGKSVSRRGGFVEGIDRFDAAFFGISPREAAFIDPQHRLLLETAWEAMEDSGAVGVGKSATGVFVGISTQDYAHINSAPGDLEALDLWSATGGVASIAANRISYCLDLRGPSIAVDTACSSALVALHLAVESLARGECALALVGGVNALLYPAPFVSFSRSGMLSPDGRCRAFDARANGFVRAEGAGVVVLKPLSAALAAGDLVYAVIRSTALNQDGRTVGMMMPSEDAQSALLANACRKAGVKPRYVQYVEAHGTGTPVGDPIEAAALGRVFGEGRRRETPLLIGSVKTNIGHLEAGAGIAGLIKTALTLSHGEIPPTLHFETPNPEIPFANLGLQVVDHPTPYDLSRGPAFAGVNSFGFGGTNAHAILQSPVESTGGVARDESGPVLLPLSAKTREGLVGLAAKYGELVKGRISLRDVAFSAGASRDHHACRRGLVASDREALISALESETSADQRSLSPTMPVFVFSGQGPQWWGMGRELLETEEVFRSTIISCDRIFRRLGKWSLVSELTREESNSRMDDTAIAQPAIFALQVALVSLWESWGIRPSACVGHSVGEAAAAYTAGALRLNHASRAIFERGRCMGEVAAEGRMLAVALSEDQARELIGSHDERICLGAVNSPHSVVLSGDRDVIESLAATLGARGVLVRLLPVRYAFHSHQMDPVRQSLLRALRGLKTRVADIPLFSTVSGEQMSGGSVDANYWWKNVRDPVRFASAIDGLISLGHRTFLEVGPHPVLAAPLLECLAARTEQGRVLPSLCRKEPERLSMLTSLGALYEGGCDVRWENLYRGARRVRVPTVAWQRARHWHESRTWERARLLPPDHPLLARRSASSTDGWTTPLSTAAIPFLADHKVQGQVVFPAAAFVEMAAAAARLSGGVSCCAREIEIHAPLVLPEHGGRLSLEFVVLPGQRSFQISSRSEPGGTDWTHHVSGEFTTMPARGAEVTADLPAMRERMPKQGEAEEIYDAFRSRGLEFGPAFRGIERLWSGEGEALGLISLPPGLAGEGYHFHPALLDACFQVLAHALPPDIARIRYLPVAVRRVRVYGVPGTRVWSHAVLAGAADRSITGNLRVFEPDGSLLIEVEGFECRSVQGLAEPDVLRNCFYEFGWEAIASSPSDDVHGDVAPLGHKPIGSEATHLLLADESGVADELAAALNARGQRTLLVVSAGRTAAPREDAIEVDPREEGAFESLLGRIPAPGLASVIHLWNLDQPDIQANASTSISEEKFRGAFSILALTRALVAADQELPRLFVVTRGAQMIGPAEAGCPLQAAAVGAARVIMNEHPRLRCCLVDLDPARSGAGAVDLLRSVLGMGPEDETAWRGGTLHAARLRRLEYAANFPAPQGPSDSSGFRLEFSRGTGMATLAPRPALRIAPGPGEVEICVGAVGVNFRDVLKALGIYPSETLEDALPGDEFAGVVVAMGEGVDGFCAGDRVFAMAPGSFRSHITLPAANVIKVPEGLSTEEACTLPVAFLTASYALNHLGRICEGERVLIHSAAGGVGLAAVQVAKQAGALIFATAGSDAKRDYLRSLGISHVLDSRTLDFASQILDITNGRGVDLVLNSLAGEALLKGIECLAPGGRFLEIGKRDIYENLKVGLRPFRRNLSFFAVDLAAIAKQDPALIRSQLGSVIAHFERGELLPLPHRVFPLSEVNDALRTIARAQHTGKIVVSFSIPDSSPHRVMAVAPDSTVLVVGGLSGFGLEAARWFVRRGARNLAIMSRRGTNTEEAEPIVSELTNMGARVRVLQADVSNENDVRRVFDAIAKELPPLRGIVHSAMVIEDKTIASQDAGSFDRVTLPKVEGALHLHRLSAGLPLDFFVMFSSVAAVVGSPGQSSYAAANAFLDALARHRRALGLPALSINWGSLGRVGYLARDSALQAGISNVGLSPLEPGEALSAMERMLAADKANAGVFSMDWERAAERMPRLRASPTFGDFVQASKLSSEPQSAMLAGLPLQQRVELILVELQQLLVAAFQGAPANPEASLGDLGLDSLLAVELTNQLDKAFGVSLPLGTIRPSVTPRQLAEAIAARCADTTSTSTGASVPADSPEFKSLPTELPEAAGGPVSLGHRVEALALRSLVGNFRSGDLVSTHRNLRRMAPVLRQIFRQDLQWANRNLLWVFGNNLSPRQRQRLASIAFENHLLSHVEGLRSADVGASFQDGSNLLDAIAKGRGVLLCGVHLGSWEPVLRFGAKAGIRVAGVYRAAHNPLSDRVFQEIRRSYGIEWIPSGDTGSMVECLRRKGVVGLMTDLNTVSGGIVAEFLGMPAMCPSGPARLAKLTGASIVPAVTIRRSHAETLVCFLPEVPLLDPEETTRLINEAFQPWILDHAEQYNWLHPRWRMRPDGSTWSLQTPLSDIEAARTAAFFAPSKRLLELLK